MWRSARAAPQIDVALTWNELPEGGKLYSVLGYDSRSSGDGGWGRARVRQSVLCVCLSVCLFVCGAVCCFMNEQTEEWVPGVKDKEVDSEEGFENQNCKSTFTVNSLLFYVGFCCCFLFFTFECPCLISLLLANARQLTLPPVAQGITFCNESTCFPCFHSLTSKSGAGSAEKTYRHPSPSRDSSVGLWFLNSSAHWRSASLWVGVVKVTWVCPWKSCRKRGMWTEVTWILQAHLSASGKNLQKKLREN